MSRTPQGASQAPSVQIFGTEDSPATRAAIRFFKERRFSVHLVDVRRKPMAAGELRRFAERLGVEALADRDSRAWAEAGLGYLKMDAWELVQRLLADQRLLRLPLVRLGNEFAAGRNESAWKSLISP
jgi:arsenate reductase-like glutaredoxin family protein